MQNGSPQSPRRALLGRGNQTQAELLADILTLLIEGACVSWQTVGSEGPGVRFVEISEAVIASFSPLSDASTAKQALLT